MLETRLRNLNQDTITQAVIARLAGTPEARLKEVMTSLVQHLHAFARDVKLTEEEWFTGIQFLTATGQKCDGQRQEFVLLSDMLGLSMLTVAMNGDKPVVDEVNPIPADGPVGQLLRATTSSSNPIATEKALT